jgi:hypothetical protein
VFTNQASGECAFNHVRHRKYAWSWAGNYGWAVFKASTDGAGFVSTWGYWHICGYRRNLEGRKE